MSGPSQGILTPQPSPFTGSLLSPATSRHSSRGNAKTFLENEGLLYSNNRPPKTASYPGIKIFTGKENGSPYHAPLPPHTHSGPCPSHKAGLSGLYLDWGLLSTQLLNLHVSWKRADRALPTPWSDPHSHPQAPGLQSSSLLRAGAQAWPVGG